MHRLKTKFSSRVNRVASGLERRGIRATYELHDRVLSNRSSRRRFAQDGPELDDVQRRIVTEVDAEGYSTLPFEELFTDGLWSELEAMRDRFVEATEADLAEGGDKVRVRAGK